VAFVFAGERVIGEFGIGLSGAVLLDAFVLRTVLVPALMHTLGRSNWYLPAWLDRVLPHVGIDPPDVVDHIDLVLDDRIEA
jgi:putative drug exporter of the RND superfamily